MKLKYYLCDEPKVRFSTWCHAKALKTFEVTSTEVRYKILSRRTILLEKLVFDGGTCIKFNDTSLICNKEFFNTVAKYTDKHPSNLSGFPLEEWKGVEIWRIEGRLRK